jgi:exopolyphosphatase/guanosine-5'-triphosphate,3'-diphosphate pyrophosphatase
MKAAIDLGTNTFHLIIADEINGKKTIIYKTNQPVKLGEDITQNNEIIPIAFERALKCLKEFKHTLDVYNVEKLKAVATSGVRSAKNGQLFIDEVKKQAGIEIEIINGETEAQYIYQGVKSSGAITGKSLIMDIGGGSTEFIVCDENKLLWKKSYNIGASRLMQKFFHSNPLSKDDETEIIEHLDHQLTDLKLAVDDFKPDTLIGSAGAFETYAEMIDEGFDVDNTPFSKIDLPAYHQLSQKLLKAAHEERVKMPRLIPLRVDMIVMATLQTNYILAFGDFKILKLSTYDLKMGVLDSF